MTILSNSNTLSPPEFIDRLEKGLADKGHTVYRIGRGKCHKNISNVHNICLNSKVNTPFNTLFLLLKLALYPKRLSSLLSQTLKLKGTKARINFISKVGPVLLLLPDIIHIHWAPNLSDWLFFQKFNIRVVCSLRGRLVNVTPNTNSELLEIYRKSLYLADGVHSVSAVMIDDLKRHEIKLPNNTRVIYSGVKNEAFTNVRKYNDEKRILIVGRDHWIKGYNYALRVLPFLDGDITMRFIGFTPTKETQYIIKILGIEKKVVFIERMAQSEISKEMRSATILLVSSVSEGIANVAIEAMYNRLLVVSSRAGGMSELIAHKETGFLFENRDVEDMRNNLMEALRLTDGKKRQIIEAAFQKVKTQHDYNNMIEEMENLYYRLI